MTTTIFVTFQLAGIHCWPDAPDRRYYLRAEHRHRFGFRVECAVSHQDRELEYHDLQYEAEAIVRRTSEREHPDGGLLHFGTSSCEQIADALAHALSATHRRRFVVTVDEDGEAGATVTRFPPATASEL